MARYLALRALVLAGHLLPLPVLDALARGAGTLAWWLSRRLREMTRDHMRHVLGPVAASRDVDTAARECVRTAARGYAEFAHLTRLSPEVVRARIVRVDGMDALLEAGTAGGGVIIASAHLGAPEVMSHAAPAFGIRMAGIAEPLRPPRVHDFVQRMREVRGVHYFAATLPGLRDARAHLAGGGALGLLVDRDVLGTGRPYAFFGERASMPDGAVELALRTGAPVFGAWCYREPGVARYRLAVERIDLPPATGDRAADVAAGMRVVIARLEAAIRAAPGQWYPLVPVWTGLPADRRGRPRTYNGRHAERTAHGS